MSSNPANPSSDRLALLYQLSQTFNSSLDLDEVLNRVLDEVITAIHAERGFVMLKESDKRLVFRVARGLDQTSIAEPQFQVSLSVVEQVARNGQPLLTSDAQADERFNLRQSVMFLGLRSILCVPLKMKDRIIGVIYADSRLQSSIFSPQDLDLLNAIASSAAIAIENARLYQVAVEKGRIEQELQMARRVQVSLLPRETPEVPGWRFVTRWRPAREVGGDYYDFIQTSENQLGFLVADVTDKSIGAALFMAFTRSIVRANMDHAPSPAAGIQRVNELICSESDQGLYVTLFYAEVDPLKDDFTFVNAGHNPGLHCSHYDTGELHRLMRLTSTGMPLGVDFDSSYTQQTIHMKPGELVCLYTDGVTEAMDADENQFGLERLEQTLIAHCHEPAERILDAIDQALHDFCGSTPASDDITVLIAKRL